MASDVKRAVLAANVEVLRIPLHVSMRLDGLLVERLVVEIISDVAMAFGREHDRRVEVSHCQVWITVYSIY